MRENQDPSEWDMSATVMAIYSPWLSTHCDIEELSYVILTPLIESRTGLLATLVLDSIHDFGRRDWTRTNDPHHVKVGKQDVAGPSWTSFLL